MLVVGSLGVLASIPGQTNGVSVFTDPLIEATGLSRLQLAVAYLIGTGTSGLIMPKAGGTIDRFGSRRVALFAVGGLAATLTALSFVGPMPGAGGVAVMGALFGCLRFTGQGLLTLTSRTMISQWFERRRGLVSSASNLVMSMAFSLSPALLLLLIDVDGFRTAWRLLAIGLIVLVGAVVLVFFRDAPESSGLVIDGGQSGSSDGPVVVGSDDDATRGEAIRTLGFWAVTIPVIAMASTATALTFHIVDFGAQLGISERSIVAIFVPIALVAAPITLVSGAMIDQVSPYKIAGFMSAAQIVMYLAVGELDRPVFLVVAIAAWGAAAGCYAPLTSAALPRLFGRRHLGAISGVQMGAMVLGSAMGPALFAVVDRLAHSYRPALWCSVSMPLIGIAAASLSEGRSRR